MSLNDTHVISSSTGVIYPHKTTADLGKQTLLEVSFARVARIDRFAALLVRSTQGLKNFLGLCTAPHPSGELSTVVDEAVERK